MKPTADRVKTQLPTVRCDDIPTVPEVCPGEQDAISDPVTHYAVAISQGWQKTVSAILYVSKVCAEADQKLDVGQRQTLIAQLPFDRTVFEKLSSIGSSRPLYNPEVEGWLPPNWTMLYIARKLSDEELKQAIAEKVISPNSNREQLRQWIVNNCSWAAPKALGQLALARKAGQEGEVQSLMALWDASSELSQKWRVSAVAVRSGFLREIRKDRKLSKRR